MLDKLEVVIPAIAECESELIDLHGHGVLDGGFTPEPLN